MHPWLHNLFYYFILLCLCVQTHLNVYEVPDKGRTLSLSLSLSLVRLWLTGHTHTHTLPLWFFYHMWASHYEADSGSTAYLALSGRAPHTLTRSKVTLQVAKTTMVWQMKRNTHTHSHTLSGSHVELRRMWNVSPSSPASVPPSWHHSLPASVTSSWHHSLLSIFIHLSISIYINLSMYLPTCLLKWHNDILLSVYFPVVSSTH